MDKIKFQHTLLSFFPKTSLFSFLKQWPQFLEVTFIHSKSVGEKVSSKGFILLSFRIQDSFNFQLCELVYVYILMYVLEYVNVLWYLYMWISICTTMILYINICKWCMCVFMYVGR